MRLFAKRPWPTANSGHAHVESCMIMGLMALPTLPTKKPPKNTRGLLFTNHLLVTLRCVLGREPTHLNQKKAHLHFVRLLHLFQSYKTTRIVASNQGSKCALGNLFARLPNCGMVNTMKGRVGIQDGTMHILICEVISRGKTNVKSCLTPLVDSKATQFRTRWTHPCT